MELVLVSTFLKSYPKIDEAMPARRLQGCREAHKREVGRSCTPAGREPAFLSSCARRSDDTEANWAEVASVYPPEAAQDDHPTLRRSDRRATLIMKVVIHVRPRVSQLVRILTGSGPEPGEQAAGIASASQFSQPKAQQGSYVDTPLCCLHTAYTDLALRDCRQVARADRECQGKDHRDVAEQRLTGATNSPGTTGRATAQITSTGPGSTESITIAAETMTALTERDGVVGPRGGDRGPVAHASGS